MERIMCGKCSAVLSFAALMTLISPAAEKWIPVPLGEPGNLAVEKRLRNEPELCDVAPERREGLVLFDETHAAVDGKLYLLTNYERYLWWCVTIRHVLCYGYRTIH